MGYRIGFDVGGTFTDFTIINDDGGAVDYFKVSSTPDDPSEAIESGLASLIENLEISPGQISHLGHGTTVATNMAIERKGARTGLITTRGFRDVLEIGRQTRPHLYDYRVRRPEPLVPRHLRIEIAERMLADGSVYTPLDEEQVKAAAQKLADADIKAVVVCFLHSYRNAVHERRAREILADLLPGVYVSLSSEVLPEFREFERLSTTVLNAYMGPRMGRYLERLLTRVEGLDISANLDTVHSNGGLMSVATVREMPVRTCVSGPAAGVIGAAEVGRMAGFRNLVTFDVGGTSTDVSIIVDGQPLFASDRTVAGFPVRTPMVDIHVIGAGGGSIAAVDDAGSLKVGPTSAGAVPGPVAYDLGGNAPTITDANIVLGRLDQLSLLDGRLPINAAAAKAAIQSRIAEPLGIDLEHAAYGILRIAAANMNRAIHAVSTEKGHDIREFALIAYGGAGPLHAADLAREAGIDTIIIPQEPGTLCARGILLSDITMDFVRSELMLATVEAWDDVRSVLTKMHSEAEAWLIRESVPESERRIETMVDARYDGQNYELAVEIADLAAISVDGFVAEFKGRHNREYGYDIEGRGVEIVNCRVRAVGQIEKPDSRLDVVAGDDPKLGERDVFFGSDIGWRKTPIFRRDRLPAGTRIDGPAIVEEMSSTTVTHPSQQLVVDEFGNLTITRSDANEESRQDD